MRRFQLHLVEQGTSATTINATITGLKLFFQTILDRSETMKKMRRVYEPRKSPEILSVEEVTQLLDAAGSLKYLAALGITYCAGLRASEVVHLKSTDIDSERMLIRTEQGKGKTDRPAILSPALLQILRAWWRDGQRQRKLLPGGWLFPGQNPVNALTVRQLNRAFHFARDAAGIDKRVRYIPCAMPLPPICWSNTTISVSFRSYSGARTSRTPPATPTSRPTCYKT